MKDVPYSRTTLLPKNEEDRSKFWEYRVNDIGDMFPLYCMFDAIFALVIWFIHMQDREILGKSHVAIEVVRLFLLLATWYLKSKLSSKTWLDLILFNLYVEVILHVLGFHLLGNESDAFEGKSMRVYEMEILFSVVMLAPSMFHVGVYIFLFFFLTIVSLISIEQTEEGTSIRNLFFEVIATIVMIWLLYYTL